MKIPIENFKKIEKSIIIKKIHKNIEKSIKNIEKLIKIKKNP